MPYKLLIPGDTPKDDKIYDDNYSPVEYHEDSTLHKLKDIGQCMIVRSCEKPTTFESEFLHGTDLSATDFEMHYIYAAEYLYVPKDKESFAKALPRVIENTRRSTWCVNVVFHVDQPST